MLTWPAKDPEEVKDYTVDFTDELDGDTISGPATAITLQVPGGVTITSQTKTTTSCRVWLSGGTAGATAVIEAIVTTAGGRTLKEVIVLPIVAKEPAAASTGYGSDEGFDAWLAVNGFTLPAGAPTRGVLRQRGSDYIDGPLYGPRFSGAPAGGFAQERAWPRTGAIAYGAAIPTDVTPVAIVNASYYAAYREALKPDSLAVTISGGAVKREKAEGLEVEYFESAATGTVGASPTFSVVDGLLAPYLVSTDVAGLFLMSVG